MISLFGNKKIHAFGLDISASAVKAMQLKPQNGGFVPYAFSEVAQTGNVISNNIIVNEEKLSENIIRALTAARKIDTRYVVVNVPEAKSFVRMLKIPKMAESEIEGAIPYELEQDIPVPVEQVYLDWQLTAEVEGKMEVLVTAAPKDYIDALIDAIKMARLKPAALELESQAISRTLIGPDDAKQAVLVLDIGAAVTNFIVVDNGILEYTSSLPIAGNAFTESISRSLGNDAEKLKKELGLVTETKRGNIRQAVLPLLDNLVDEIKNVVRFHEDHSYSRKPITKVLLCGGSSRMSGIADYISARLNLGAGKPLGRVMLADPWVNNKSGSIKDATLTHEQALGLTTAIGLAMRGLNVT